MSGFPALARLRCQTTQQSEVVIVNTQPVVDILIGNNTLNSAEVDFDLIQCDGNGLLNGTFDSVGQTPLAPPSPVGQAAITSLVGKGWTVTTDPWQFVFDDGGGGFWDLVVDTAGNVGTTAGVAPATADVILDDGVGGFWKVAVDVTGLRYTIADPGPATAAPVLFDGEGGFWQLVVDALGNLGATLVYHYPVYWEPYTEIITWTDTHGVQTGNLVDFTATVDLATLTNVTASGLAITELIFDGTQLPALTTIDCSFSASLTNLHIYDCNALTTIDCNTCDITGTLDITGCSSLTTFNASSNANLTGLNFTDCVSLVNVDVSGGSGYGSLQVVNVTNCTSLNLLNCDFNAITTLVTSGATALSTLVADNNQLASVDVSTNTNLTFLELGTNLLNALDVDSNVLLTYLSCYANNLNALDVTNNTLLTGLYCNDNSITALDVSNCTVLDTLFCYNNSILALDLSLCSVISAVNSSNNGLTSLTIGSSPNYVSVIADTNALNLASVDGCLSSLVANCLANAGACDLTGGTSSPPTLSCANPASDCFALNTAGWTATTN